MSHFRKDGRKFRFKIEGAEFRYKRIKLNKCYTFRTKAPGASSILIVGS